MDSLDVYEPNPGSPEAVFLGCTCPPIQRGPRFTVHERCPLHGFETVRPLFQVGPLDQIAGPEEPQNARTHLFAASQDIAKRLPDEKNYNSG
jgi:hypothetical protein